MTPSLNYDFANSEPRFAHRIGVALFSGQALSKTAIDLPSSTRHFPGPSHSSGPFSFRSHSISACLSRVTHLRSTTIQHPNILTKTPTETSHCPIFRVLIRRPSIVRFRLPLTPPRGSEMPPKSVQYREFGTKDAERHVPKLNRSASRWRKADLDLLGVDYDYQRCEDIHIQDAGMPAELMESNSFD